ncbi:MAG: conjugal transfer protein TraD [Bryobacteraceae bacterium]|nr:conjugal transfer protein TraD [Bryobacteraceae bacterium]
MRRPRDIDAELKDLAAKAKTLKTRKVVQLGELVIATGADALEPELLAGLLLSALETKTAAARADWTARGEAFFCKGKGEGRKLATAEGHAAGPGQNPGPGAAS